MSNLYSLSSAQLKRAAEIKDKISALEKALASLLGSSSKPASSPKKQRRMSAAGRARLSKLAKARWAQAKKSGKKSL